MKVLWVVNTLFPAPAERLGLPSPIVGGWMYALANELRVAAGVQLAIATVCTGRELVKHVIEGTHYYLVPERKTLDSAGAAQSPWKSLVCEFAPDLVHIHGTEYAHGKQLMDELPSLKYVISIQGLVSVCERYYLSGLSCWDVIKNITLRDVIRMDTLFQASRKFRERGFIEREYLTRASLIVGRTDWDRVHVLAVRPKAPYRHCDECLRDEFYSGARWERLRCRSHSIFLSQATYPLKGAHQLLRAAALLRHEFPDVRVVIAGDDITKTNTVRSRLRLGGYAQMLRRLIQDLGLVRHVEFTGPLCAHQMRAAYLLSHVFACPSSVENSPNSLGEAQILGMPCVASYAGGIPSMIDDGVTGLLHRFEEHEMLASNIRRIFVNDRLARALSDAASAQAAVRHDRKANAARMMKLYSELASS